MTSIDSTSPAFAEMEMRFRRELTAIAARVFSVPGDNLDRYLGRIAELPAQTRLLAMHQDPLELVSSIARVSITPKHREAYRSLKDARRAILPISVLTQAELTEADGAILRTAFKRADANQYPFELWAKTTESQLAKSPVIFVLVVPVEWIPKHLLRDDPGRLDAVANLIAEWPDLADFRNWLEQLVETA